MLHLYSFIEKTTLISYSGRKQINQNLRLMSSFYKPVINKSVSLYSVNLIRILTNLNNIAATVLTVNVSK